MEKFEKYIVEEKICDHGEKYVYYKSECECCDPLDATIYKRVGCKKCIMSSIDTLFCGGHYRSFALFKNGKLVEREGCEFENRKTRYRNLIIERMEDMSTSELKNIFTMM